jgi:hypothetical protein
MDFTNIDILLIISLVILAILGWLTATIIPVGIWGIAMGLWAIVFGINLAAKKRE